MSESSSPFLRRLGLHRPELRAWATYDVANSTFVTSIMTAVFPVYYVSVANAGTEGSDATFRFAISTTLALAIVAVMAPFLGALADYSATKKRMLASFAGLGIVATACMFFIERGDWILASVLFVLGNVGASGSFVFYDALLPHVARPDEVDRVSSAGYALGYLGGGLLLAVQFAWILSPDTFGIADAATASRLAFLSVAIWWFGFSIPIFRRVPEPQRVLRPGESADAPPLGAAARRLAGTLRDLRGYRHAFLFLVAFLVYNDGIGTIIKMATAYGKELQIPETALIGAIVLVQFVGVPCAFLFGALASRIGAKRAIFVGLAVYAAVTILGYFMRTSLHFLVLAGLVGTVQGGCQALSRSLFASMIPSHRSTEFFAFFAVFEKFAGLLGPAIFAGTIAATGSSRNAILAIIAFFLVGGTLLALVDVEAGRRAAREAEEAAAAAPTQTEP